MFRTIVVADDIALSNVVKATASESGCISVAHVVDRLPNSEYEASLLLYPERARSGFIGSQKAGIGSGGR